MIPKVSGGITNSNDILLLKFSINGGTTSERAYPRSIDALINRFEIMSNVISDAENDIVFIKMLTELLKWAKIDFIPIDYSNKINTYSMNHNMNIIHAYLRSSISTNRILHILGAYDIVDMLNRDANAHICTYELDSIEPSQSEIKGMAQGCTLLKKDLKDFVAHMLAKKDDIHSAYKRIIDNVAQTISN